MNATDYRSLFVLSFLAVAVVTSPLAGVAAADHGSPANFTVYPETTDDRSPDTSEGAYVMSSAGADAFDSERGLKYVDFYWIESDQASFTDCGPDNARTFGIDRGNNNTGTQTDVDLLEHMKNYEVGDRRITLEIYDESDLGGDPVNLNAPDATIAVLAGCVENTGDPGWYQFQGFVNGTTYDDGYEEVYLDSHYFWIGDFESEAAAREELGPPPSETGDDTESTPAPETPTPTAESTDEDPDAGDDGSTGAEPTATPTTATQTATGPTDQDGDADDDEGGTDGQTTDGGSDDGPAARGTPTPGNGAGFGSVLAVASLLAAALLARRL